MDDRKQTVWDKVATLIVDKRNIVFLFFIAASIFCVVSSGWVQTNDDITDYLPADTETRQGLTIMDEEFVTYATARVMVENITLDQALELQDALEQLDGVTSVEFYDPEDPDAVLSDSYKDASALFTVTLAGEVEDQISLDAMDAIRDQLSGYDFYISSEVGAGLADTLDDEIQIVMLVAVVIIITVLLFTSKPIWKFRCCC